MSDALYAADSDPYAVGDDAKVFMTATMASTLRITERRQLTRDVSRLRVFNAWIIDLAVRYAKRHARRRGNVVVQGSVVVLMRQPDVEGGYRHAAIKFRWSEWIGVPAEHRETFAAISVAFGTVPVAYVEPAGRVHAAAL